MVNKKQEEKLEEKYFILERQTSVKEEDLNEENIEGKTLNYATKVQTSEELVEEAYKQKSIKCFGIDTNVCKNISSFSKNLTQFVRTENKIFHPKKFAHKLITFHNPFFRVDSNKSANDKCSEDEDEDMMDYSEDENNNNIANTSTRVKRKVKSALALDDFYEIGRKLPNLISELPIFNFCYGSFAPALNEKAQKKEKKKPKKHTELITEEKVKPTDYDKTKEQDDEIALEEINILLDEIDQKIQHTNKESIDFYDAIIDPNCLTTSVTNIFHSAFMVKEGMLHIQAKNGKNLVRPTNEEESGSVTRLPRHQQVLRFNKATFDAWRREKGD